MSFRNSVVSMAPSVGPSVAASSQLDEANVYAIGNLTHEDLRIYTSHLSSRPYAIIPPVGKTGLPSLDEMNIPHYDPSQLKFSPNADQRRDMRVQARRGPRYMLTFLNKKLGFEASQDGQPAIRRDSLSLSITSSVVSSRPPPANGSSHGSHGARGASLTIPAAHVNEMYARQSQSAQHLQLPLTPTSPQQQSAARASIIFSKLKKKVSLGTASPTAATTAARKPPSPMPSEEEADLSSMSSRTSSLNLNAHPSNTTHITVPASASQPQSPTTIVSAFTRSKPKKAPSILSFISSTRSTSNGIPHTISLHDAVPQGIKKSHKYMANMGKMRFEGSDTATDFELIIDPKFPRSVIDVRAILREAKDHTALLANQFQVIATPVYNPESQYNRVSVEITIIPIHSGDDTATVTAPPPLSRDQTSHSLASTARTKRRGSSPPPVPAPQIRSLDSDPILNYRKKYLNASVTYREMMINSCNPRETPSGTTTAMSTSPSAPRSERMPMKDPNDLASIFVTAPPSPSDQPTLVSQSTTATKKPKSSWLAEARAAAITGYTSQNAAAAASFNMFGHGASYSSNNHGASGNSPADVMKPLPTPYEVEQQLAAQRAAHAERERAQEAVNNRFAAQWAAASKDVIVVGTLPQYSCVLGRDWLEMLQREAFQDDDEEEEDEVPETVVEEQEVPEDVQYVDVVHEEVEDERRMGYTAGLRQDTFF